jgi:hypothetical protein
MQNNVVIGPLILEKMSTPETFDDPEELIAQLVPLGETDGMTNNEAGRLASEYVRKSKSWADLIDKLRVAEDRERDVVRHGALRYLRIRAEAISGV